MQKVTVYFDGACPLCRREIRFYAGLDKNNKFEWLDIWQSKTELKNDGIDFIDAIRNLHVKGENGRLFTGVDSFIYIWRRLPYFKYLAILVALPPLKFIAKILYKQVTDWRLRKRPECNDINCKL